MHKYRYNKIEALLKVAYATIFYQNEIPLIKECCEYDF